MQSASSRILRIIGSMEVTTIGLLWLFGLVLAGTFYQITHSITETVSVFFHAWFVFVGPVPLPAAQFVFALLGANLLVSTFTRIPFRWEKIGLFVVHIGLIAMVVGGMTQRFTRRESILVLAEGESDSYSYDIRNWEVVVGEDGDTRYPVQDLPDQIDGHDVSLIEYHVDAVASPDGPENVRNIERNRSIEAADPPRANPVPGAVLQLGGERVLLHGNDRFATRLPGGLLLRLEPSRYPISAEIRLEEFEAEFFQGSTTPRAFTSRVLVTQEGSEREAIISMNNPLRMREYTVFQLGYDSNVSRDVSVFQVVRNPLRWVTYAVTLTIAAGLILHLVIRAAGVRRRRSL